MDRLRAYWNRGWFAKALISIAGLMIVCCVIGILVPRRPRTPDAAASQSTVAPAAGAQATTAPEPTTAPAPTDVPKPTDPPAPSATPEPTVSPTEVPSPTPLPEPIVLKGRGKTVTESFTPPGPVNRAIFTHSGRRNFIVQAYRTDGKEDILVNKIGPYKGARPIFGANEQYFEVNADGDWTITIEVVSSNPAYADGIDGTGDVVSDVFMPSKEGPTPYTFSHDGKRNFIAQLHCAGGDDVVANEIGSAKGDVVVRMREGPCLWEVQADGTWSIKPK